MALDRDAFYAKTAVFVELSKRADPNGNVPPEVEGEPARDEAGRFASPGSVDQGARGSVRPEPTLAELERDGNWSATMAAKSAALRGLFDNNGAA